MDSDARNPSDSPPAEPSQALRGRHRLPREVVRRDQRERLLAGAARAVEEKGFAKVTVADILHHAAVSRPTFYRHFSNKEECVEAVFGTPFASLVDKEGRQRYGLPTGSSDSDGSPAPALVSLPPGRHGLPREVVQRDQRERLLAATKKAVEDCGFAKVTVARICGQAGTSKSTFYEYFASKEECIEAVFGAPFASLVDKEAQQRFGPPTGSSGSDGSPAPPSPALVPLPPGRHGLPREVVRHNQRARLLAAAARAVEEKGFAKVTIADIVRHAAVSRRTFYDHFGGKEECLEAAFGGPADTTDGQSDTIVPHQTHGSSDASELEQAQKELVNRHRRERVIAGTIKAVEERGFAKVTIGDIVRNARVSRKTLYELFAGKDGCIEAAFGSSLESLIDREGQQRFGLPPGSSHGLDSDGSSAPPSSTSVRPPSGRHGIPREAAQRNQRERLLAGAARAVEEKGFAKVTVADIIGHAAVSRTTFYRYFSNVEACLEAAFGGPADTTDGQSDTVDRSRKDLVNLDPRERVIAGTIKAVEERGLAKVRIADIVRHAGVSSKTLYELFSNKNECIEAVFGAPFASLVDKEVRQRLGSPTGPNHGLLAAPPSAAPVGLPGGRHGFPREMVQRDQRARLLAGANRAVEERGRPNVRITDILRHAKVSRLTFYELFAGKEECLAAAERAGGGKEIDSSANRPGAES